MGLRARAQWWGVSLDAPDALGLARFYSRLLDWELFADDTADIATVAPSKDAGYHLGFQTEAHYVRPVWPAQPGRPQMSMHLEIEVDDLDEAVAHAAASAPRPPPINPRTPCGSCSTPPGTRSACTSTPDGRVRERARHPRTTVPAARAGSPGHRPDTVPATVVRSKAGTHASQPSVHPPDRHPGRAGGGRHGVLVGRPGGGYPLGELTSTVKSLPTAPLRTDVGAAS